MKLTGRYFGVVFLKLSTQVYEFLFESRKPLTRFLVTGGIGFIGSNYIRHLMIAQSKAQIVNLDKLSYGSNPANLKDLEGQANYSFVKGDICDAELVEKVSANVEVVVNFAAESHVDRKHSCQPPIVLGKQHERCLDASRIMQKTGSEVFADFYR